MLLTRGMRCCVLALMVTACSSKHENGFVLRGTLPGAPDSAVVELRPNGARSGMETYVVDGRFELRGKVYGSTFADLRVDKGWRYWKTSFFMENGELRFTARGLDSVNADFHAPLLERKTKGQWARVPAQEVFDDYQRRTHALRADLEALEKWCSKTREAEDFRRYRLKRRELEEATRDFIRSHSCLAVNLQLAKVFDRTPLTYDEAYVSEVLGLFADCRDTCRVLRDFRARWREAEAFAQGKELVDAEVESLAGGKTRLLDQLGDGWTVVDLWASWCGSCRMEFPMLRKVYARYGDKVKFVSLAVSDSEETWRKAVEEEDMPWAQFRDLGGFSERKGELYRISSIPNYLLVDADGRVRYRTSRSGDLEVELENIFNE